MYLLILLLVPVLFLFHTYAAMAGLALAIVLMYVERTKPPKRQRPSADSEYTPGYQD
jgi:hypothetical protein